jgi:TIR domain
MPKIAISYRRADSQDITGRIFDRLIQRFGRQSVFRDIDSIRPGIDFREQIEETLQRTDVLLAIVGPKWLGRGKGAESRLDNEADLVRIEVATALKRKIPVIPVLVGGTKMPTTKQLPDDLKAFAFRHAVAVDSGRDFDHHVDGLIRVLGEISPAGNGTPAVEGRADVEKQRGAESEERRRLAGSQRRPRWPPPRAALVAGSLTIVVLAAIGAWRMYVPVCCAPPPIAGPPAYGSGPTMGPAPTVAPTVPPSPTRVTVAPTPIAPTPSPTKDDASGLVGTSWTGVSHGSGGWQAVYLRFEAGQKMGYSWGEHLSESASPGPNPGPWLDATWSQNGNAVHIDVPNGYATWDGKISGGTKMQGTGKNWRGVTWTWSVTKD